MRLTTAQKLKFSIKDFFSKCDQISSFLLFFVHCTILWHYALYGWNPQQHNNKNNFNFVLYFLKQLFHGLISPQNLWKLLLKETSMHPLTVTAWKVFKNGVSSGLYSVQIQENTDQKKLRIWTLFMRWVT